MEKNAHGRNRSKAAAREEPYRTFLGTMRQRRMSEATARSAAFAFGHLAAYLGADGKSVRDVTEEDLIRFQRRLEEQGLSAVSADLILRHVRRLFRWLAATGRIFLDPATGWVLRKPGRPLPEAPTVEQVAALLAQPDIATPTGVRDRAFIEVAYYTGGRLSELAGLTLHDLHLDDGLLRVLGKGCRERMAPLGREAVQWLRRYLADARPRLARGRAGEEPRLWIGRNGHPIQGGGLRMLLRAHSLQAGLPVLSPHSLRRACATHLLRNGAHPVQIQTLLGHTDLSSLSQYLRLTIRDIRRMHAASKVGR